MCKKRQKIKQLFNKLGISAELTLKKLFKPAIAKKVLLHYVEELECKRFPLLDYKASNDKFLLADLIMNNPTISTNKILQLFGLKKALEIVNIRELRVMFSNHNQRGWQRLMKDAQNIKLPVVQSSFKVIKKQIIAFKTLKISS